MEAEESRERKAVARSSGDRERASVTKGPAAVRVRPRDARGFRQRAYASIKPGAIQHGTGIASTVPAPVTGGAGAGAGTGRWFHRSVVPVSAISKSRFSRDASLQHQQPAVSLPASNWPGSVFWCCCWSWTWSTATGPKAKDPRAQAAVTQQRYARHAREYIVDARYVRSVLSFAVVWQAASRPSI